MQSPKSRNQINYIIFTACVDLLGLASRYITGLFPLTLGKYPGDAL